MDLIKKYEAAYANLETVIKDRIQSGKYMALGYTSNLDYLCDFSADRINEFLKKYLPDAELMKLKAFHKIHSMEELLSTIVFYCLHGIGGEAEICDTALIRQNFKWTPGMGGTGTQAAMALAAVGCPSVVHLTDDSEEVCGILKSPYIYTISPKGELIGTSEVEHTAEQEVHCIIQFKKGDAICLGDQMAEIPVSNRLILTKMTVNVEVPFFKPYFTYIEQHAQQFSSNVLSSFNEISDQELLMERLDYVKSHIQKYRRKNRSGILFFEDAHYHDYEIRKLCIEHLYSQVDIVSLNEEELKYTLEMYDYRIDIEDIVSCVKGVKYIRDRFAVQKGIIVHTKDYAMYVGEKLNADIETGLMYGNMLATAKAFGGWYGTKEQIGEILKFALSENGVKRRNTISGSKYNPEVVLVPSKYIDKPKYTIGLGDSFVAGVQMCF